jgi:hypothetical protein
MEQRQEWQAEDSGMIACNPIKQLDTNAFQLVAAYACCGGVANDIKIAIEKGIGEGAHGQAGGIDMFEQNGIVAHHRQRGMEYVGLATQSGKLGPHAKAICGLGESLIAKSQCLVCAQHDAVWMIPRNHARLFASEQQGGIARFYCPRPRFDCAFVDLRWSHLDWDASGF